MKPASYTNADKMQTGDPGPLFHTHPTRPTEVAAARKVAKRVVGLRREVLTWIADSGAHGLTSKEARALYEIAHGHPDPWSVPPRFSELLRTGHIVDTGEVRDGAAVHRRSP